VLLPVYIALGAAIFFYLLVPIAGAFVLRNQWRRFRERVAQSELCPLLRYHHVAAALNAGIIEAGSFRLQGTIEAIERTDRLWVRGQDVSALVDLSKAPLYVLAAGQQGSIAEAGSIERLRWNSVSSLVEGTSIFVAGRLVIEEGRPVFVDHPGEELVAVCHEEGEDRLLAKLISGGRAPNEYWSFPTHVSLALGLVAISVILLVYRSSPFSTVRSLIFLAGAGPVLPFAPPGIALFLAYHRLWRRALEARTARDLFRLPLLLSKSREGGEAYLRERIETGETPPESAMRIELPSFARRDARDTETGATLFVPQGEGASECDAFLVEGDPEAMAQRAENSAFFYAAASGIAFGLAVVLNFVLAFLLWRSAF
jgi:hypothetical protein